MILWSWQYYKANLLTTGAQLVSICWACFSGAARHCVLMPDNELLRGGSRHIAVNAKQGLQCQDSEEQTIPWQLTSLSPSGSPH